jgi:hypothetical protein
MSRAVLPYSEYLVANSGYIKESTSTSTRCSNIQVATVLIAAINALERLVMYVKRAVVSLKVFLEMEDGRWKWKKSD